MLKANYHTHTSLCDGKNTPQEMVDQAISLGFKCLGFSGHMDYDNHMDLPKYIRTISGLRDKYKDCLDILIGLELDNMYSLFVPEEVEYTIGSTHFLEIDSERPLAIDLKSEQFINICDEYFQSDYYKMSKSYYDLVARTYDRLHCSFIGHFDLITRFNDELNIIDEESPQYYNPALEAMSYLCEKEVPFEVNCGAYNRKRKRDVYPCKMLLKNLFDKGGRIIISSDAHQRDLLDGGFEFALHQAVDCGFRYVLILKHNEYGKVVIDEIPIDSIIS